MVLHFGFLREVKGADVIMKETFCKYFMENKKKFFYFFQAIVATVGVNMVLDYLDVSVYSLVFLIAFYSIFDYLDNHCRKDRYIRICALIFSIFILMGKYEYWAEPGAWMWEKALRFFFIELGSYYILCYFLEFLFSKYDVLIDLKQGARCGLSEKIVFWLTFVIIALVWGVTWMADYPAVITPDCVAQINQIMGEAPLSNFHPLANTLWLKMQYMLLRSLGITNINNIFGLMGLIQLLIMDICVSFQVKFLYKRTHNLLVPLCSISFYTFIAYHASFSVTVGKDTVFSNIILLFLLSILEYFEHKEDKKHSVLRLAGVFVLGIMVNIFRGNGYYAYAFFLLFVIGYGIKKKEKSFTITMILAFLVSSIIIGPVYKSFEVVERPYAEVLSIPVQQIAYVAATGQEIPENQYELLSQIVDVEQMAAAYTDWISDPVKSLFTNKNYFTEHKLEYLKLWISLGIKYPKQYFIAYVKQTYGYWYPAVNTWPYDMGVFENKYGIEHMPILPSGIVIKIEELVSKYLESPLLGSFWCIATYTWGTICMFIYSLRRKNKVIILNYSLLLGIWGSLLISTPVYATFRYIYPLVIVFPLIVFMPYAEHNLEEEKKTL